MNKPDNIFSAIKDEAVLDYIEFLEERVRLMEQNSDAKLFVSIKQKLEYINKQINALDLDVDYDENGNNKNYKNFRKFDDLTEMAQSTTKKLEFFKMRTTPEEIEKEEKYIESPVERFVFKHLKNGERSDS